MRVKSSIGVVVVLCAIAAASACGGSTSGGSSCPDGGACPSAGNGGIGGGAVGGNGGIGGIGGGGVGGTGGFGGGGTGGFGGTTSPCQAGCDKLASADCPAPFNHAACVAECQTGYSEYPECSPQFDALVVCVTTNATVSCDGGEPVFVNADQVCPNQVNALSNCIIGTGGAGGVGGVGGVGGAAGMAGMGGGVPCGGTVCNGWKLGGLIDMQACCTPSGCGAVSDATIEAVAGVPQGCYPLNNPGTLECSCPPITFTNPINNEVVTHPGCCWNGNCGVQVNLTSVDGPNLGCAVPTNAPPQPCAPLHPPPCD